MASLNGDFIIQLCSKTVRKGEKKFDLMYLTNDMPSWKVLFINLLYIHSLINLIFCCRLCIRTYLYLLLKITVNGEGCVMK